MERWKEKVGEKKKRGRARHMQRGREKLKGKEGVRAIGCVFMLWSVSVDRDERSKHASPLSPWSVSMETLFLTLTHILYVHSTCTVFPAVGVWFKWTVWKSRVLIMSFMWTCMQHRGIIWPPLVEHKHQTLKKWSCSSSSSTGLRLEPQFTQLSCNSTICLSF